MKQRSRKSKSRCKGGRIEGKNARLDELNILLNMDKKENEIVGGEPDEGEAVGGRKGEIV
ncbi:MAG: hypothetical protein ACLU92_02160 [Coprococcus comes]